MYAIRQLRAAGCVWGLCISLLCVLPLRHRLTKLWRQRLSYEARCVAVLQQIVCAFLNPRVKPCQFRMIHMGHRQRVNDMSMLTSGLSKLRRALTRSAKKNSRADGCSRKRAWCSSASCASGHRLCARAGRGMLQHTGELLRELAGFSGLNHHTAGSTAAQIEAPRVRPAGCAKLESKHYDSPHQEALEHDQKTRSSRECVTSFHTANGGADHI